MSVSTLKGDAAGHAPMGYRKVYACVDNSELSTAAVRLGIMICKADETEFVASHVYAAKLHDRRFRAMESGLPEKYQEEVELERQRRVHDSLIVKGLELITDSYLEETRKLCEANGIPFAGVSLEGRNWKSLAQDIESHDYDLIALGAHGIGRVPISLLGTVVERLLRRVRRDILICRNNPHEIDSDLIVVCLDGSSRSWGGLMRGIHLAKAFDKKVAAVSAFDPYFHYTVFGSLSKVLSEKARRVFRFEEQEKLHEDIIDSGLAKIYQAHLNVAKQIASDNDVELETHLLDGKAHEKILEISEKTHPWLLVVGRIGIHSDEEMDIGGNTENICRLASCNVLVVDTKFKPPGKYVADETVVWTREAEAKMRMVPPMARGVAMQGVQNFCLAEGHTVVTTAVLHAAIRQLLPSEAIKRMGIEFDGGDCQTTEEYDKISLSFSCEGCGYVHRGLRPKVCPVCGREGEKFRVLESSTIEDGIALATLGGRQLVWEPGVVEALEKMDDPILRDQIKSKLEKKALARRLSSVSTGLFEECDRSADVRADHRGPVWTDPAVGRLRRVPRGFMRDAARRTVEEYARKNDIAQISLEVAEKGLAKARKKMGANED